MGTHQSAHEAIFPKVEHSGIPDVSQRTEVVVLERFRNKFIRGFTWNHVLGQACFPLTRSVQFCSKVFALLRRDLGGLLDTMDQGTVGNSKSGEPNRGKSGDFIANVLQHGRKFVQGQAFVLILVVEFKEFFDL